MNHKTFIFILFIIFIIFSCTEDYESFPGINSVTLVVNGCITNEEPPYRFSLFEDIANGHKVVSSAPVLDAHLTITDNFGNFDELKPLWEEQIVEIKYEHPLGWSEKRLIRDLFRQ